MTVEKTATVRSTTRISLPFTPILFAVDYLGFAACCALEIDDASELRFDKSGADIVARYARFVKDLPRICRQLKRRPNDLTFADLSETVEIWPKAAR